MTQNSHLLSESSQRLLLEQGLVKQRIVITGASGWLGRTFVALVSRLGHEVLLIGSQTTPIFVDGKEFLVHNYDSDVVEKFNPTVLIDFAFVTRERLALVSESEYRNVNEKLISRALEIYALPSVSYGMFTSSGAAVFPKDALEGHYSDNPYGYLKRKTEEFVMEASERLGKKSIVIRPWSLSGTLVMKDYEFAFSSFIRQSFGKEILVKSPNPVFRRYVAVEDFLALGLAKLFSKSNLFEIFDSGGELISLVELAQKVAELQNHKISVVSHQRGSDIADEYYSDNKQWVKECELFKFVPETISQQISRNLNFYKFTMGY